MRRSLSIVPDILISPRELEIFFHRDFSNLLSSDCKSISNSLDWNKRPSIKDVSAKKPELFNKIGSKEKMTAKNLLALPKLLKVSDKRANYSLDKITRERNKNLFQNSKLKCL